MSEFSSARRFRVTCSCGKGAIAAYYDDIQEFVCLGWKFSTNRPMGWHCGGAGHYQAAHTPISDYYPNFSYNSNTG